MASSNRPTPPTASLPPLGRLASSTPTQITDALANLRTIYFPPPAPRVAIFKRPPHIRTLAHDDAAPDSGYASADDDDDGAEAVEQALEVDTDDDDTLRADVLERSFAIKWLTGFTARTDTWLAPASDDGDALARTAALDAASTLLSAFVGSAPEQALTRTFSFGAPSAPPVTVQLNDAPLLAGDHTSVGLQSWASSVVLAERMCAAPRAFGLGAHARVVELGAGTGLLSIAAAQLLPAGAAVVATDYHPAVLANLERNVCANGVRVSVRALDWERPDFPEGRFSVVLAADVVYHPAHAAWIARCVEGLLVLPAGDGAGGVFWMIIALRATGRHEGLADTVGEAFPQAEDVKSSAWTLAILKEETVQRLEGVGRADEGGYRLYKMGWVRG